MVAIASEALLKGSLAAAQLRREILSGEIPEGAPLRQAALARRFGISTIPIREALQELVQAGLVVTHPFQGASVALLVPEEILQYARVRIALETEALAQAFPFHTPATLAKAGRCLQEATLAVGFECRYRQYSIFLKALYGPGVYPYLVAEIMKAVAQSYRYAYFYDVAVHLLPADLPMQREVLTALASGDLPQAQAHLRLLYMHTAILAASLLYQRQLETPSVQRRPRGRPRKIPD